MNEQNDQAHGVTMGDSIDNRTASSVTDKAPATFGTWQPIETAPDDMDFIIGATRLGDEYEVGEVYRGVGGDRQSHWYDVLGQRCDVVFWMPLPDAPQKAEGK